jgi:hypothetical protein
MAETTSAPVPDADSAAAAVETLRAELEGILGAIDALDQKAALIPAALGAIAALFIAPDTTFTGIKIPIVVIGLTAGGVSIVFALAALAPRFIDAGPNAQTTAASTHLHPAAFNRAVAGSLANSIDRMSEVTKSKGFRFNVSAVAAGIAIAALGLVRVV